MTVKIADGSKPRNPFVGLWGCPAATFVRFREYMDHAAERALYADLGITGAFRLIGQDMFTWPNGMKRRAAVFAIRHDGPFQPRPEAITEIRFFTPAELEAALAERPDDFAPSFVSFYRAYKERLLAIEA